MHGSFNAIELHGQYAMAIRLEFIKFVVPNRDCGRCASAIAARTALARSASFPKEPTAGSFLSKSQTNATTLEVNKMKNHMKILSKSPMLTGLLGILAFPLAQADITSWNNSPMNYQNSELNYENSPLNYNNSPMNYENSPLNYNSERIIRDNSGKAMGYAVPKSDGGVNYFDMEGHREGYQGPDSR
jgi:hypothetical protein